MAALEPAGPTRRDPAPLLWAAGLLLAARIVLAVWEHSRPARDAAQRHSAQGPGSGDALPGAMRDAEARPAGK